MNYYIDTRKFINKPQQNEDVPFDTPTRLGTLFVVLDFSSHDYTHMRLEMEKTLQQAADSLSQFDSFGPEAFLGHLAQDINNFVFVFGQKNCGGKLFCTAAISLLQGNQLWCLTYGDARINVFRDSTLLLMNGAKYSGPSVVGLNDKPREPVKDDPEQLGRLIWDQPLTHRVEKIGLNDRDVVLMFSDGFEDNSSPQQKLTVLHRAASSDPKVIADELFGATEQSQDDRTLIVICGPYPPVATGPKFVTEQSFESTMSRLDSRLSDQGRQLITLETLKASVEAMGRDHLQNNDNQNKEMKRILKTVADVEKLAQQASDIQRSKKKSGKEQPATPNVYGSDLKPGSTITAADGGATQAEKKTEHSNSGTPDRESGPRWFGLWSLVEIDRSRPVLGLAKLAVWIIAGAILLGLGAQWVSPMIWPDTWQANADGNILRIVHESGDESHRLELTLANPASGWDQSRYYTSFDELADVITLATTPRQSPNSSPSPATVVTGRVKVKANDTLAKLAQQYETNQEKLKDLNPGVDWSRLKEGSEISVPLRDPASNP